MSNDLKTTALSHVHEALGAKMVPFAGYNMPVQYNGLKLEHAAVREAVGMFDVSHMGEFFVDGPQALDFLLEHPDFHMESNGKSILIFHKERVASVAEFKLMVSFARDWAKQI